MKEVRCYKCGRLLAMQSPNGDLEIKAGRQVIVTERAVLSCPKCAAITKAGKWTVDRKRKKR